METNLFQTSGVSPGFRRKALLASTAPFQNKIQIENTFLDAHLRESVPIRLDKLPWHEFVLENSAKRDRTTRHPARPLSPHFLSVFLDLAKWRRDFPPPQAERLAAASLHQVLGREKKSLIWSPEDKKWESLGVHDCDWLLFDFLLSHEDRRAGPWLHAKAQLTLSNLFHVKHPMAAPTPVPPARRRIPRSLSSRDLSDLHGDIPTCWREPIKAFTRPFVDWNGEFRKIHIKPEPSSFKYVYHNPKFPIDPRPITDDRENYFAKERQQEGIQSVKGSSGELILDVLGGARYKPIELIDHIDPFDDVDEIRAGSRYLKSFAPEEVPLFVQCDLKRAEEYPSATDPQARHEADKEKFAHAAGSKCPHGVYDPHRDASYCSVCNPVIVSDGVIKKEKKFGGNKIGVSPSLTQLKTSLAGAKELLANEDVYGHELPGLKWKAPRPSITWRGEEETRAELGGEDEDHFGDGADWIINPDGSDIEYLRRLGKYGGVFRGFYGSNPQRSPVLTRDCHLFETALSMGWKSAAEKKEFHRRIDRMHFFIHGVCPTGVCGINNRCADPKLSPWEREVTHGLNLLQRVAPDKMAQLKVGTYYFMVVRQGQPRVQLLKAKTAEKASAEFDRLVDSKVKRACSEARRRNKSEKEAEGSIRDAYQVDDLLYLACESWEQSGAQDVAAD